MKVHENRKGFSLVEVIVSMLIVSIILTFATSFFFTGEKMFSNTIKGNTSKMIGDNVLDFISEKLIYASNIEIKESNNISSALYDNVIYLNSENTLGYKNTTQNNTNIYGNAYYSGNTLKIIVNVVSDYRLKVSVKVMNGIEEQYSTTNTLNLMNMNLLKNKININNTLIGKDVINPVISFN